MTTSAPVPAPTTGPAAVAGGCPGSGTADVAGAASGEASGDDVTTSPHGDAPSPAEGTGVPAAAPASAAPAPEGWVAEVRVDPDWYAEQESADPLPSPGPPLVVRLGDTSVLLGRASRSRGVDPDVDLSSDTGISRRHAQLTTDGARWWVEDLGSSNGTYVGPGTGPLPTTPVPPGEERELATGDHVYLGAWTRITVRRAAPGEL